MGDIKDITASTQEKQGVIRNNSGNSTERTTKVSQLIRYFIQLCEREIYITHTNTTHCPNTNPTGIPTIQKRIQQLSLFHLNDWATQTNNPMPSGMHNSGSRIGDELF